VERCRATIETMRALSIAVVTALVATAPVVARAGPVPAHVKWTRGTTPARYSRAVTRICAGALLFEHPHHTGTRADALEVASDIRASTARRLALVVAVPVPRQLRALNRRWISSQRRLASVLAQTWVQIYDAVEAAQTPEQRAALPGRVRELMEASYPLRLVAGRLELKLHVPDCTGD